MKVGGWVGPVEIQILKIRFSKKRQLLPKETHVNSLVKGIFMAVISELFKISQSLVRLGCLI